ncbi:MAG: hypothetical protein ACT4O1_17650 [Gemmatimonadota bacterium]
MRNKLYFTRSLLLTVFATASLLAACDTDELLEVDDPDVSLPTTLTGAEAIPNLVAGAIGDFQVGFSVGDTYLTNVGNFTDEFRISDTFITRQATDRRAQQPPSNGNTSDAAFNNLQRARRSARVAVDAIRQFGSATDPRIAEIKSLEAYTYLLIAEAFCRHVPFSDVNTAQDPAGPPLDLEQMLGAAVARFDTALTVQATSNLAKIGKGRALLSANRIADAAAAVAGVPTTFIYFLQQSDNTPRQENGVWNLNISNRRYTVSELEGGNGLPFRSASDPRVPWRDQGRNGFDGVTRLFEDRRHPDRGSDVVLADGIEARMIEAEAALRANNGAGMIAILNTLRASVTALMTARVENFATTAFASRTLPPLTDPGTAATRADLLFRERAFWFYSNGTRLGDLRRLIRQYGRSASNVFPVGDYHKGGEYGPDVNFPVPFDEENNPNFNRSQCVVTEA